jgi:DNA-binding NarL/FixJ family response regulator
MIRLILVDDHKIMRDGLKTMLGKSSEYEVVGVADTGRAAVSLARQKKPDLIIMDVSMPDLNGIEAARQILMENPGIKIIILSMHSDKKCIDETFKAGVSGYLLKDCVYDELSTAIKTACNGQIYLSPGIASMVVKDYVELLREAPDTTTDLLTPREKEVLQLIAEEHSTLAIAKMMNLSPKTVESHRRKLMEKLNVHNIAGLTKVAIKLGLTSC